MRRLRFHSLRKSFRRALRSLRPDPVILMYHRVATPEIDPWGLAVSPARFDEQMALLRNSRTVMPLGEMIDAYDRRALPRAPIAVTFDDGYADNLLAAKPILARHGVPATLFLATGSMGQEREYWWDELARLILLSSDAVDVEMEIGSEIVRLKTRAGNGDAGRGWLTSQGPRNEREALYLGIWSKLRLLHRAEIASAMARIRPLFSPGPPSPCDLPMTAAQLAELVGDGLFELGGHTISHPVLPSLSAEEQADEIVGGKLACEALINRRVEGFAYPYGDYDDRSKVTAGECGFHWACSTRSGAMPRTGADRYDLPRVQVLDWSGKTFARELAAL